MFEIIGVVCCVVAVTVAAVGIASIIADYCLAIRDRWHFQYQKIAAMETGTQLCHLAKRFSNASDPALLLRAVGKSMQEEGYISSSVVDRIYEAELRNKEKANA